LARVFTCAESYDLVWSKPMTQMANDFAISDVALHKISRKDDVPTPPPRMTGYPVGGVCPFGLAQPLQIYCDLSLKQFAEVYPAAGSRTASVCVSSDRLAELVDAEWADICSLPSPAEGRASAGCAAPSNAFTTPSPMHECRSRSAPLSPTAASTSTPSRTARSSPFATRRR
jgi:hypothetical protein